MSIPINYYENARVLVRKGKQVSRVNTYIISKYTTAYDVMTHDVKTMTRLRQDFLKNTKAKESRVIIEALGEGRVIGNGINDLKNGNKPS